MTGKRKRSVPIDRDLCGIDPNTGEVLRLSRAERLLELATADLQWTDPGDFASLVHETRGFLERYDDPVESKNGQLVLKGIVERAKEEFFGDLERWEDCSTCQQEFQHEFTLESANAILKDDYRCPTCRARALP